jgi:protein TonB
MKPFIGAMACEMPELALDDALPGATTGAEEIDRRGEAARRVRTDRVAPAAGEQWASTAGPSATHSIAEEKRKNAALQTEPESSVPARHKTAAGRNTGAASGVIIMACGMLTLVVALVKGNPDQIPPAPRPMIADEQPVRPTAEATVAAQPAVPIDQPLPPVTDGLAAPDRLAAPMPVPMLPMGMPPGQTDGVPQDIGMASGAGEPGDPGGTPAAAPSDTATEASASAAEAAPQAVDGTQLAGDSQPGAAGGPADSLPEQSVDKPVASTQPSQNASRQAAATPQTATQMAASSPPQPLAKTRPAPSSPPLPAQRQAARVTSPQPLQRQAARAATPQPVQRQAPRVAPPQPVQAARTPPPRTVNRQVAVPAQQRVYRQVPRARTAPSVYRNAARTAPRRAHRQTPATWLAGGLVNSDNPGGRFRGVVYVQFTVQTNGRVTGCRASSISRSRALEARTCRLVEQRLLFSPALDGLGRRIPSVLHTTYTWGRVV